MNRQILQRALAGDRFSELGIVDSHCHMGPFYNFYFPTAGIEEMLEDADRFGIRQMCIAPHASLSCDYRLGNRQAAEVAGKYPGRVMGLLVLNPNMPDEAEEELNTYYPKEGFIGVKLHSTLHRYGLTDDNCLHMLQKLQAYGGYTLLHTWETSPACNTAACEVLLKAFPDMAFIMGHSAGTSEGVQRSIQLVNRYENAYMDTSGFEHSDTWIEDITEKVDPSKLLFGSDCPYHDVRGGISRILFADLEDGLKAAILGDNFRRLVSRYVKKGKSL